MTVAYIMEHVILKGLLAVFDWMDMFFVKYDAWGWIFGSFGMYITYRFLLKPLLGGRAIGDSASDRKGYTSNNAKTSNKLKKESSEENG